MTGETERKGSGRRERRGRVAGVEQDSRASKVGSRVDTLPSPMARPHRVALQPTPLYCCSRVGGKDVRMQLCLYRKQAAKQVPEQEPG